MSPSCPFLLIALTTLLSGCGLLDTLAVIDSSDGTAVITDRVAMPSGDRIICVQRNNSKSCNSSNADIVISNANDLNDVGVEWAPHENNRVIVSVVSGELEKAPRSVLNGRVTIEYR